ncbi:MAG: NAD(P)H-dependent oxidoreductase subunit E [Proteobacteria bacterium]|nr:NAD(P)H-dependent oxidoreductase subunit E [Pseudomonadota bacterium]
MDKDKIQDIVEKHRHEKSGILAILHEVQQADRQLTIDSLEYISELLNVPFANVYGLATFYSAFSQTKKGETMIRVCDGIACHVNGSDDVISALKSRLNIEMGETTWDETVSLEKVHCLGLCSVGPNVSFNQKCHTHLNEKKILEIINKRTGDV